MFQIKDINENLKIIFKFGSLVYKNKDPSNINLIAIGNYDKKLNLKNSDLQTELRILTFQNFLVFLEMHEISILECVSLLLNNDPSMYKVNDDNFKRIIISFYKDNLNLKKLKNAVSKKALKSFNSVKEKMLFENENSYIGLKSLFHSIRILEFGHQIQEFGYIKNFSSCNNIWNELMDKKDDIMLIKTEKDFEDFIVPWKNIFNEYLTILSKKGV